MKLKATITKNKLIKLCDVAIKNAQSKNNEWIKEFKASPFTALEWSDSIYANNANLQLHIQIKEALACDQSLDEIVASIEHSILKEVTTRLSTGICMNVIHRELNRARVELLKLIAE